MAATATNGIECRYMATPHTWPELIWCGVRVLGVTTVVLLFVVGVFGLVAWRTIPPLVEASVARESALTANIEKQTENITALTANLEKQTANITAQTQNIQAQTEAVKEVQLAVASIAKSTQERDASWREFSESVNEVHESQNETLAAIADAIMDQ